MTKFETIKSPIDYFQKIAVLGKSEVQTDENQLLIINADNESCVGFSELLPIDYGSLAINTSCLFKKGFHSINKYQYDQNWLYVLFIIEPDSCSVNISYFRASNTKNLINEKFELDIVSTQEIHWKQGDNTYTNKIILYISEEWLKNTLNFIPNIASDNWKYLRDSIKGKTFHNLENTDKIAISCSKILQSVNKRDSYSVLSRKKGLSQLRHDIITLLFENRYSFSDTLHKKELNRLFLAHNKLIENFQNPPINLDELSKISGLNRQKFQRIFKEYFGQSFYQYYQEKRFEHARMLIEKMNYSVSEAAYAINFKHLGHFTQTFEKIHGVKPSELKNKNA